jgi:hypothetical protein
MMFGLVANNGGFIDGGETPAATPPVIDPTAPPAPAPQPAAATPPAAAPAPATPSEWAVNLDPAFADILKPQAEKLKEYGVSSEAAQKMIDAATADIAEADKSLKAESDALNKKYGGAEGVAKMKASAAQVMAKVGISAEEAAAVAKIFGSNKVYEIFHGLAAKMGVGEFKEATPSAVRYAPNNLTKADIAKQINTLHGDEQFMAKIAAGDAEARSRLNALIDAQFKE